MRMAIQRPHSVLSPLDESILHNITRDRYLKEGCGRAEYRPQDRLHLLPPKGESPNRPAWLLRRLKPGLSEWVAVQ
ncbi:unnamed protein product [Caretta caretta]